MFARRGSFLNKHSSTSSVSVHCSAIFKVSFEMENSGKSSVSAVNVKNSESIHSNAMNVIVLLTSGDSTNI